MKTLPLISVCALIGATISCTPIYRTKVMDFYLGKFLY